MDILRARREDIASKWAEAINHAKQRYDENHQPLLFKSGDRVLLSTQDIAEFKHTLAQRWIGPCEVLEARPEADMYRLRLPEAIKRVHDWVHVSRLKPYTDPLIVAPAPGPQQVDEHEEWEIEKILRAHPTKRGYRYLIQWKGYPDETEWKYEDELEHAKDLVADYHARHPRRAGRLH